MKPLAAEKRLREIAADEWERPISDCSAARWALARIAELESLVKSQAERIAALAELLAEKAERV